MSCDTYTYIYTLDSRLVMSCHVMSRLVMSCHVMSSHVFLHFVITCHVISRLVISCHVMSCHSSYSRILLQNLAPESFFRAFYFFLLGRRGGHDEVFETVALCGNPARSDALAVAPRALRACRVAGVGNGATWASFCVAGCGDRACWRCVAGMSRACRGAVPWGLGSGRVVYTHGERAFRVAGCGDRARWRCVAGVPGVSRACRSAVPWGLGSGRVLYTHGQRAFRVAGCGDRVCRACVAGMPRGRVLGIADQGVVWAAPCHSDW